MHYQPRQHQQPKARQSQHRHGLPQLHRQKHCRRCGAGRDSTETITKNGTQDVYQSSYIDTPAMINQTNETRHLVSKTTQTNHHHETSFLVDESTRKTSGRDSTETTTRNGMQDVNQSSYIDTPALINQTNETRHFVSKTTQINHRRNTMLLIDESVRKTSDKPTRETWTRSVSTIKGMVTKPKTAKLSGTGTRISNSKSKALENQTTAEWRTQKTKSDMIRDTSIIDDITTTPVFVNNSITKGTTLESKPQLSSTTARRLRKKITTTAKRLDEKKFTTNSFGKTKPTNANRLGNTRTTSISYLSKTKTSRMLDMTVTINGRDSTETTTRNGMQDVNQSSYIDTPALINHTNETRHFVSKTTQINHRRKTTLLIDESVRKTSDKPTRETWTRSVSTIKGMVTKPKTAKLNGTGTRISNSKSKALENQTTAEWRTQKTKSDMIRDTSIIDDVTTTPVFFNNSITKGTTLESKPQLSSTTAGRLRKKITTTAKRLDEKKFTTNPFGKTKPTNANRLGNTRTTSISYLSKTKTSRMLDMTVTINGTFISNESTTASRDLASAQAGSQITRSFDVASTKTPNEQLLSRSTTKTASLMPVTAKFPENATLNLPTPFPVGLLQSERNRLRV
ncbi:uncharacterized protein LOC141898670 [Tubulanus polymorphus]|uniref:uncharacterized protein LOC141898670 n=1 Tax=Tubulanus polymorphus TaxID=672921 RepID=UPI003DA3508C